MFHKNPNILVKIWDIKHCQIKKENVRQGTSISLGYAYRLKYLQVWGHLVF